ncbi:MAG: hypothetical protein A2748_03245 [Candidatus Wildermuthbacteria bacterium RIFCSPHIGHO2_01_FULL_45_20]|uniref:DUF5679 domain-containing protein n=1 Tax=Candidatus Wildermuthbacteria bacterium RIFCSPHIGHO2_02_FULL_45_25 TaxID=1802450 RepID=A0A1G2R4Z1_9BACT|nr:MAG: hypothetical protein A2748_03245 [Candidatus Wildermuthbacteria bacterium RIFCSPHIGHO2_01_FULL_45_20]OHA67930.1 MAG: hypothetical protein A3C04_04640 [Candidatus Wildermuthbacteria bacterium RIFCSPHIGHO2_02_FULL_45_25]
MKGLLPLLIFYLMAEAYCVKCKAKREMANAQQVEMQAKGGGTRPAMKGECPVCKTGMFRILPKPAKAV